MNSIIRRCVVGAGIILSGTAVLAGSYVRDSFEGEANGAVLSGRVQWVATHPSVMITNMGSNAQSPTNAVLLPTLQSLTNWTQIATTSNKVWSDFWTVPRPFQSTTDTAPAVDTNATAQLFVQSNGYWAAIYRDGGNLKTSTYTTALMGSNPGAHPNDGSTWCHVSVLHDYSNKVWSLFVGGAAVATNLGFINQTVNNYQWFAVQNGGGDNSNKTLLDTVLITNAVPSSLTLTNGNGLRAAWALMHYNDLNASGGSGTNGYTAAQLAALGLDPFTTNYPPAAEYAFNTNNGRIVAADLVTPSGESLRLTFVVGPDRTNRLVGTANPGGTFGDLGLSWYSGADGSSNAIIDTEGVNRGARFFYRVASTDPNGVVGATSTVTYAMYRQPRAQASTYYWAGIPINYGASNSLDSTLGQHLARGLQRNANPLLADQLTVYYPAQKTFYLNALGQWYEAGVGPATNVLPLGHGVVIERVAGSSSDGRTNAVLTGVALGSFSGSVTIPANRWSFLCWPEDASNRVWSLGGNANDTNPATADRIWMPSRSGRPPKQLRLWTDGWQFEPRTSVNPSNDPIWAYMQAGEGFFHTNSGIQINWAP